MKYVFLITIAIGIVVGGIIGGLCHLIEILIK